MVKGRILRHKKNSSRGYITPRLKVRLNQDITNWYGTTALSANVCPPHEISNCKSKNNADRTQAKSYVAALAPVDVCSDIESVESKGSWCSAINEPPHQNLRGRKDRLVLETLGNVTNFQPPLYLILIYF